MALGLNRSEVVCPDGVVDNHLSVTFWTIVILERISTTITGRPTAILYSDIDAPYPQDLPSISGEATVEYAYIRAMISVGEIGHNIMSTNYLPRNVKGTARLDKVDRVFEESVYQLQRLRKTLPQYLCFSDTNAVVGTTTQEVQRTFLGVKYYMVQILMFRPAQVFVSFFDSLAVAQDSIGIAIDLSKHISLAIRAAKNIIQLTHDAVFVRCPRLVHDGNMVVRESITTYTT
jgi:hypothetical protein